MSRIRRRAYSIESFTRHSRNHRALTRTFTNAFTNAFTLVELLVVIGVIAVLLGILLPVLSRARESANVIKCSANLHSIGIGFTDYLSSYNFTFPPSYIYAGFHYDSTGAQQPNAPIDGYINWSAFIFDKPDGLKPGNAFSPPIPGSNNSAYQSPTYSTADNWQAFQCPSVQDGGLPPTNAFASNNYPGLPNDTGPQCWDFQAPRLDYTVNEVLCPRNKFQLGFQGAVRYYRYVRASQVTHSSNTILATEFNGNPNVVSDLGAIQTSQYVCVSHRPVHAFIAISNNGTPLDMSTIPQDYRGRPQIVRVSKISPNPDIYAASPGSANNISRLDWVGRNHGSHKFDSLGRALGTTNFLYMDGHVENKSIYDTFTPWQWGDNFYSLYPNSDVNNSPTTLATP